MLMWLCFFVDVGGDAEEGDDDDECDVVDDDGDDGDDECDVVVGGDGEG